MPKPRLTTLARSCAVCGSKFYTDTPRRILCSMKCRKQRRQDLFEERKRAFNDGGPPWPSRELEHYIQIRRLADIQQEAELRSLAEEAAQLQAVLAGLRQNGHELRPETVEVIERLEALR